MDKEYSTQPDLAVKSYGLDLVKELSEHTEEDWVFGGSSQRCIALIPLVERQNYLPDGEVQVGKEDFQDCATRSPINLLETKFSFLVQNKLLKPENEKWLKDKGYIVSGGRVRFSDRFIAMKSGTTRTGNSLKAPIDAIHKYGLIPKSLLPAKSSMDWTAYHNEGDITPKIDALGGEFIKRFTINYERVYSQNFPVVIEEDMIGVGGFAWPFPVKGEYPKDTRTPNHAFLYYRTPRYFIFDNYIDSSDGDFTKHLADNYILTDFGYRLFISEGENTQTLIEQLQSKLLELLIQLRDLLGNSVQGMTSILSGLTRRT